MTLNQPLQGESDLDDSSWPLLSLYYDAAKDEDEDMVGRWRNDAKGIIIFTGLFSAAVAALLAVTVQDLRPSSQDTSAFYLGNIYQVLADPNATRASLPSPLPTPPPFSPPRYAIWVNSLWFLSLAMSLSCAMWATSLQQWARRYLRRSQPTRLSPEQRAQMRAFFSGGVDKTHIPWAVEGLPTLLHLSLFLFFCGLAIFLFHIDREVFGFVIWWIVLFSLVYGLITLLPIFRHDSTCYSPLSTPVWTLCTGTAFVTFKILAFIANWFEWESYRAWKWKNNCNFYSCRLSDGLEKLAEQTALGRPSEMFVRILDWTVSALETSHDGLLKKFFEAIPGFLKSDLLRDSETVVSEELGQKLSNALDRFWVRTFSSNLASGSVKPRRIDICLKTMDIINVSGVSTYLFNILSIYWDQVPHTLEMGQSLAYWCTSNNERTSYYAQSIIARILTNVQGRDDNWFSLAARAFGLPERDLFDNSDSDDSRSLAVFLYIIRQSIRPDRPDFHNWLVLETLSNFDIRNTGPRLQHEFCTLWNEIVRNARIQGRLSIPVFILTKIRHLYTALHPTSFTPDYPRLMYEPTSHPFCEIAAHHPDSTPHVSVLPPNQPSSHPPIDGNNTASRQAEQGNNVVEPPLFSNPTTTSGIGAASHGPDVTPATNPVHSHLHLPGASPAVVAAASQDITSTTTFSHPIPSTASTHAPIPTLASVPTSQYNAAIASTSSHPASPYIHSSFSASRPTGSATFPHIRVRGLVNTGSICFANAVLQVLVNSPPFWNLFRELGNLKGQRRAEVHETGGDETPLVDASMTFFKEFIVEHESSSTQQRFQPATGGTSRADEEKKGDNVVDSFEPTYFYDAMKEKRQLKLLLDDQQQDAEAFLRLYFDALDEELSLLVPIRHRQSAGAELEAGERGMSQFGQIEVGSQASQGLVMNFVESPITHIFGGKFCYPLHAPNQSGSVPTEDWRSLHLDIQPDSVLTVEDALMHLFRWQSMQDDPPGLSDASQKILIKALPPILVLHLKRFRYDAAVGGVIKIAKHVQFSSTLEIPSEPPHYRLYGVLYHLGESANSGHYTVDVLHPNGGDDTGEVWLHIDNDKVTPMQREGGSGERGNERVTDKQCAYLLFYCHTSPIGIS